MKKFTHVILISIFTALVACSVESIAVADSSYNTSFDKFVSMRENLLEADGYRLHIQTVVRDSHGSLVSVVESTDVWKIPAWLPDGVEVPNLTDFIFDHMLGEKEIITVDGVKYEKAKYVDIPSLAAIEFSKMTTFHQLNFCGNFEGYGDLCVTVFEALTAQMNLADGDVVTNQWTFLKKLV